MNKLRKIGLLVLLAALSVTVEARGFDWQDVEIEVVSDRAGEKREYQVDSSRRNQRSYIAVKNGEQYSIRVRNNTGERIGVVLAVDGRNIINGKKSWLKHNEPKYVLGPWETAEYEGWRSSRNRVNRFYFTDVDDSYADAWDDHSAMGVIAAAVYREKAYKPKKRHYSDNDRSRRHSSKSEMRAGSAGTGFGESEWSSSRKVSFKARNKPVYKKFIKYEWRKTLCRMGVIERCGRRDRYLDNRLWSDRTDGDFAPYPRNIWKHRNW